MLFSHFISAVVMWFGEFLMSKLRIWTKPVTAAQLGGDVSDITRSRQALLVENALLCQQPLVLNRKVKRLQLRGRDRAVIIALTNRLST